jgi:hypothetical protein
MVIPHKKGVTAMKKVGAKALASPARISKLNPETCTLKTETMI